QRRAEEMLSAKPPQYSRDDEGGLTQSRIALKHLTTLAAMYRLTKDPRYFDCARAEMIHIARFPDWGPQHFLNVAEMTAAMSIGYDWLCKELSETDRSVIREAIVDRGLEPGIAQYKGAGWWRLVVHNWNLVCNGGLTLGALAIAEDNPDAAQKVLACAAASTPIALRTFQPDGGWPEGPGYWTYGTRYLIYMLSGMQSVLGTDLHLDECKGLSETGFFRIYTEGSSGENFNFADSESEMARGAQMFWLSRRFKQPVFAGDEIHIAEDFPEMFHLLFYTRNHVTPADAKLPLSKMFEGTNVACFRSSWTDPNAMYIGFKGGDNKANHAHLDLGTFVLDASGVRWALDLGPDKYELPGYFGKERWNYYRLRTEGHNTITVGKDNQNPKAEAKIIEFSAEPKNPFAIVDLTDAYKERLITAKRGVKLLASDQCLVEDEILASNMVPIQWHFHTDATVKVASDGKHAQLTKHTEHGDLLMSAEILSPPEAVFAPEPAKAPAPESQQPNVTDLIIPLKINSGSTRIAVAFSTQQNAPSPEIVPLDQWQQRR
ncbi:MAG TPA: heparinase II/III family protein, partial [Trichormus sp.]